MSEEELKVLANDKELIIKLTWRKIAFYMVGVLGICLTVGFVGGDKVSQINNHERRLNVLETWKAHDFDDPNAQEMQKIKNLKIKGI